MTVWWSISLKLLLLLIEFKLFSHILCRLMGWKTISIILRCFGSNVACDRSRAGCGLNCGGASTEITFCCIAEFKRLRWVFEDALCEEASMPLESLLEKYGFAFRRDRNGRAVINLEDLHALREQHERFVAGVEVCYCCECIYCSDLLFHHANGLSQHRGRKFF